MDVTEPKKLVYFEDKHGADGIVVRELVVLFIACAANTFSASPLTRQHVDLSSVSSRCTCASHFVCGHVVRRCSG